MALGRLSKGQEVLFTSYAGTEVKIDGKEYLIGRVRYHGDHRILSNCETENTVYRQRG